MNNPLLPIMPPMAPPPPHTRCKIVQRYGERYCAVCGFPLGYGACDRQAADPPAKDGDVSDLARRIRNCQGGR